MKKFIFLFLMIVTTLLASKQDAERKIYESIIKTIFPQKSAVAVWTDSEKKAKVLREIPFVKLVEEKRSADFLIISKTDEGIPEDKKIFADGYLVFKAFKKQLIGGFYWQKGRANLIFIKNNLQKYKIDLPSDLKKYVK